MKSYSNILLNNKNLEMLKNDKENFDDKINLINFLNNHLIKKYFYTNFYLLSYGVNGLVIYPSFNIDTNISVLYNFISKIIDSNYNKVSFINKEIGISNLLSTIDPFNKNFIYPLKYYKYDNYYNIIMKKGINFFKIIKKINFTNIIKIILNLTKSIKILSKNNILLLDIKPDNFLFNKTNDNRYYCTMIDFSGEFIIDDIDSIRKFNTNFQYYLHDLWPYEIHNQNFYYNNNLFDKHNKHMNIHTKNKKQEYIKYFENINLNHDDLFQKNNYLYFKEKFENDKKILFQKIMIFQLGKSLEYLIKHNYINFNSLKKTEQVKFDKIINNMIKNNINERFNCKDIQKTLNNNFFFKMKDFSFELK